MLHMGFASELAKSIVAERGSGATVRRVPDGDVARVEARLEDDRRAGAVEGRHSILGATGFLMLLVFGPAVMAVGALALGIGAAIVPTVLDRRARAIAGDLDPDDRWLVWRRIDPDPEYLRGRAA